MSGGNFPDLQNARHSLPLSRFKDLANSLAALKLRYCLNLGAMVPVPNQSPVPNGDRQPAQKLKTDARGNCSRFTQMNAEKQQILSRLFWLAVQALAAAPTLPIF